MGKTALLGGLMSSGIMRTGLSAASARQSSGLNSLIWVWTFSDAGDPASIQKALGPRKLGVILKTHDGTSWMSEYDDSPDAVSGPDKVQHLAIDFEKVGVPFHAWCVVQGTDPLLEAQMCASVLKAGARSLFLDLEPSDGANYWQGAAADAVTFGEELRRLAPNETIIIAPDSRPWQAGRVPIAEFAGFANAIAPQAYWETFQSPANREKFAEHGYELGPEGVTPELVLGASIDTFQAFGLPIQPIGQGASTPDKWRRFVSAALDRSIDSVSLWRYGCADQGALDILHESLPQRPEPVAAPVIDQPSTGFQAPDIHGDASSEPPTAKQPGAEEPSFASDSAQEHRVTAPSSGDNYGEGFQPELSSSTRFTSLTPGDDTSGPANEWNPAGPGNARYVIQQVIDQLETRIRTGFTNPVPRKQ